MTVIVKDATVALRDRWMVLSGCVKMQRRTLAQVCGCERCGDQDARQQMLVLIRANLVEMDELTDLISSWR